MCVCVEGGGDERAHPAIALRKKAAAVIHPPEEASCRVDAEKRWSRLMTEAEFPASALSTTTQKPRSRYRSDCAGARARTSARATRARR